jgi:hypothetical protein
MVSTMELPLSRMVTSAAADWGQMRTRIMGHIDDAGL